MSQSIPLVRIFVPSAPNQVGSLGTLRWLNRFAQQPRALCGLIFTLAILTVALLGPFIVSGDPFKSIGAALQAPSSRFWFGTDDLGRNVFVQLLHGARVSLFVGFTVALIATTIGILVGGLAGYFGGWLDDALMRFTELVQILPRFFLAIIVAAFFGGSIFNIVLLLGLTYWTSTARILRAQILSVRERDFVLAARAIGVRDRAILCTHVLPNALPPILVNSALIVGAAILIEAGLSFLGLGDRTVLSWGYMLNNAQPFLQSAWWMSVFPGIALLSTVVAVNLLGDGLNDVLDPRATDAHGRSF